MVSTFLRSSSSDSSRAYTKLPQQKSGRRLSSTIMGGSWRLFSIVVLASIADSTAFVVKAPNVAAASSRWWSATPRLSSSSRLYSTTPARAPWTCLAPGGKVGRQKVSLERAVTSIAAPKPQEKQEQETKKATKTKRATQTEDAPMYNLLLIGDEEYNREHVVMSIQDIVPDTDNTKAAEIFDEAQETGKGMCGTYPEEEAELYVEQFTRCEPMIYADMEREGAPMKGAQTGAPA